MLKLKVGVLAGTKIYGNGAENHKRSAVVNGINNGALQGLIMTDRVGGTGFTLTGANNMIFLGSLYSKDEEDQAIGTVLARQLYSLIVGRICREGQSRTPQVYIIADPQFIGDKAAFEIKAFRAREQGDMNRRVDGETELNPTLAHILMLQEEEEAFQRLLREREQARRAEMRKRHLEVHSITETGSTKEQAMLIE